MAKKPLPSALAHKVSSSAKKSLGHMTKGMPPKAMPKKSGRGC